MRIKSNANFLSDVVNTSFYCLPDCISALQAQRRCYSSAQASQQYHLARFAASYLSGSPGGGFEEAATRKVHTGFTPLQTYLQLV
jgi:hypothetical protein